MTEQPQKKISKEAARMIFEAVLTQRYDRFLGPMTMFERAVDVLRVLDELVEDGGDTVGLFLRQASLKGCEQGEKVEGVEMRQPSDFSRDFGDLGGPDKFFERDFARFLALEILSVLRENGLHVKPSRERETNRTGLNGRDDDSHRLFFFEGDAYFF